MYLHKSPYLLKRLYPNLIWDIKNVDNTIYLSFDDGPIPEVTPFVLDCLRKYQIKATFFCIGDNVLKHPNIFQQVINEGHNIGNHSFNHLNGWETSKEIYVENVLKCEDIIQSKLFRPPYGRIRRSQLKVLAKSYKIIMWDVLTGDFDEGLTWEKCLKKTIKHTKPGSIVVFHDSLRAFPRLEKSLPLAIEHWLKLGYQFGKLDSDSLK